jgi:hypothetical protein
MAKYQVVTINCGGADSKIFSERNTVEAAIEIAKSLQHDDCCNDTNHKGNGDEFAEANVIVAEDECGRKFEDSEQPLIFCHILPPI